ncbi:O-antigen ligase [Variovorax sp. OV700]|uniref:O-antigen ligase family protein n=1 Tax=Variovorax sp. OV700 TaxID=1882826 RepID=UPI00088136A8|nr:hypothetical protein [Variovorax sp. OV700]SDH43565.1 hypothetical protein SAMN05444748_101341 [Variovorax sp. OV700]
MPATLKLNFVTLGLASFFLLATLNTAVTSDESQRLVLFLRPFLVGVVIACIIANAIKRGITPRGFIGIAIYLLAVLYGIAAASLNNSLSLVLDSLFIDVPMALSGIYLLSAVGNLDDNRQFIQDEQAKFFVYYPFIAVLVTAVVGGFIFEIPPRFNFEYGSDQLGQDVVYSLGLTNFYGLATIAAAYLNIRSKTRLRSILMTVLMLFFLALSLLGGGRGELFATILIVALILIKNRPIFTIGIISCAALMLMISVADLSSLSDSFVIVRRLTDLAGGDLSSRDALLYQVIDLLSDELNCLIFGCGPGYFQIYYRYDFGLYPHNLLAESVVSFGIFFTAVFLFFVGRGLRRYWKAVGRLDPFLLLVLFFSIVGLKSGYLFGSWIFVAAFFNLAALAVTRRSYEPNINAIRS